MIQKQKKSVMKIEIRETMDGSRTLYLKEIDEHYHSTFGAIQESRHVYIREGFNQCLLRDIRVLEIGFGTGLNCYLTILECLKKGKHVHYYAAEKFPVTEDIWKNLKYSDHFEDCDSGLFEHLHIVPWNCEVELNNQFTIFKMECDVLQSDFKDLPLIDLVYFDAFSPEKQSELWQMSVFENLFTRMNDDGILVTYCAKGYVRRLLQTVGFTVERVPGPPGKREMLRARKRKIVN